MNLSIEDFYGQVDFLATIKVWKLEPTAIRGMYDLFPHNAATGQVSIDPDAFAKACTAVMDTEFAKPADLLKEYKAERLRQREADKPKPLPPAPPDPTPSDEALKVRRFVRMQQRRQWPPADCPGCKVPATSGDGKSHCACYAKLWAQPLTDEDRGVLTPQAVVADALGFKHVQPDPKESDVVWVA